MTDCQLEPDPDGRYVCRVCGWSHIRYARRRCPGSRAAHSTAVRDAHLAAIGEDAPDVDVQAFDGLVAELDRQYGLGLATAEPGEIARRLVACTTACLRFDRRRGLCNRESGCGRRYAHAHRLITLRARCEPWPPLD